MGTAYIQSSSTGPGLLPQGHILGRIFYSLPPTHRPVALLPAVSSTFQAPLQPIGVCGLIDGVLREEGVGAGVGVGGGALPDLCGSVCEACV